MITAGIAINQCRLIIQFDLTQTFIFVLQLAAYLMALYIFITHMFLRKFVSVSPVSALCRALFDVSPSWTLKPASWVWEVGDED